MTRPIFARGMGTSPRGPEGPAGPASTVPGPTGGIGPRGPQGLPGVNAVANDEATAAQIGDSDSETTRALNAAYVATGPFLAVADGTSLTAGAGSSVGHDWPAQLADALGTDLDLTNVGVSGQTISQMNSDAATQVDPLRGSRRGVVLAEGGANDLPIDTPEATYARYKAYHDARHAAGWLTVAFTVMPRSDTGSDATNAVIEARRIAYNTMVRDNWATFADALADIGADPILGNFARTTDKDYFQDKVHLTDAGYAIVARHAATALRTLAIGHTHRGIVESRPSFICVHALDFYNLPGSGATLLADPTGIWSMPASGAAVVRAAVKIPEHWTSYRASFLTVNYAGFASGQDATSDWYPNLSVKEYAVGAAAGGASSTGPDALLPVGVADNVLRVRADTASPIAVTPGNLRHVFTFQRVNGFGSYSRAMGFAGLYLFQRNAPR